MSSVTDHVLFDIGYRIVAIALSFHFGRQVRHGLVERTITLVNDDWLDWSRWATQVFHRDTAPIRYWITIVMVAGSTVLCFVAAIVGWWQPSS
jgi:hypothetical protein